MPSEWSRPIEEAARAMYERLRLVGDDKPPWAQLGVDATDHYCIAAKKAVDAFYDYAARDVWT